MNFFLNHYEISLELGKEDLTSQDLLELGHYWWCHTIKTLINDDL